MGMSSGGNKGGVQSDINVTPLIDVVLVLLVVFMVITPMLQSGLPVDLPKATQTETVNDAGQFITVSVTLTKGWWVEQEEVDKDSIVAALNRKYQENPERAVLIKADSELEYGQVREVMDILAENRFTSVLIAAAKEN